MECSTITQVELLETSVTQCQPSSNSPVWSPFSKGSITVNSESFEAKAHHSVPCSGLAINICCKNELERKFYPLTLIPEGRERRRVSTGTLKDWTGKEQSVGGAEQTLDAPEAENRVEFGHFRKSGHYWTQIYMPNAVRPKQNMEFGAEKVYFRARKGERGLCPQNPQTLKDFSSLFKGQIEEGRNWLLQTSWYRNPLLL